MLKSCSTHFVEILCSGLIVPSGFSKSADLLMYWQMDLLHVVKATFGKPVDRSSVNPKEDALRTSSRLPFIQLCN